MALALALAAGARAADHNDPNAINSIFADVPANPADLYDLFGFPSPDESGGERVVFALTFASVPGTGVFDPDLLYAIRIDPDPRLVRPSKKDESLGAFLRYAEAVKEKFLHLKAAEVRVKVDAQGWAAVDFIGFPEGSFSRRIQTNRTVELRSPQGHRLQLYVGGRDDAFFNDLPGFFRSINYAPQFYRVPRAQKDLRELKIPKTLLELEGNTLFNFDPAKPLLGQGVKEDLPPGPYTWSGDRFKKDANGNFRFVYSGKDAQAGRNVNAIVVELPLAFLTRSPKRDRIVNAWGESWVLKAAHKITTEPDNRSLGGLRHGIGAGGARFDQELAKYKLIDTDGVPFADAALSEREDGRQLGANDIVLARHFVQRFGHLGWGFGPSISALGLGTCFDHDGAKVSTYKTYALAVEAFPRVKKCLFQELNMPDGSWRRHGVAVPQKRPFEIFIPNVCAVDMDTNGTWPFGRRLEDQVATRFLSVFLDHAKGCGGRRCTLESLSDQALWNAAPIEPKTPPNPLHNDKPFLAGFPYLAEPWEVRAAGGPVDRTGGDTAGSEEDALAPGRLAVRLLERASRTGDFADLRAAEEALAAAQEKLGALPDLTLLRAQLELKVHRLDAAEAALDGLIPIGAPDAEALALRGDIAVQRGRYGEARALYGQALRTRRSWDLLARLAYLDSKTGAREGALRLYSEAADLLTAREERHYSWIELQLGLLDLDAGLLASALEHFERAERAAPGDLQVGAHRAETLARLGRVDEAIVLDRALLEASANPEVANDLALLLRRRDPDESARLLAQADAGFAARAALYPEAALGHRIEAVLARGPAPAELVRQAEEGYRLRPYGLPGELLARAYLSRGEVGLAAPLVAELWAGGWRTPETARLRRLAAVGRREQR